jgi:single-stranded-DNA-specific exonuclease
MGVAVTVSSAPEPLEMTARVRPTLWRVRAPAPPQATLEIAQMLGLPPRLAAILYARGLRSMDALEPPLRLSPNPALPEAAARIIAAIKAKKRIRVHGDYDADGITGSSVLMLGLRELGADVHVFVPNRLTDGYGVHIDRVPEHIEGCDLFITVDCGVSNLAEIAMIVAGGVECIVTDHHAPGHDLPGCLVVHPALAPNYHHDLPALTGSGVAFHLLWAVREALGLEPPFEYADLASIGTIADLAPLLGENRALVRMGLERMRDSKWPGIRTALESHGVRTNALEGMQGVLKDVTARFVAFVIAPRINAAGRLGEAGMALELLTTESPRRAKELATYLDARNLERRKIQDKMFEEAVPLVDPDAPAIVVTKDGWHPGVMGIVASKLLERFYKPVFIIAAGKGSVRSTPGLSAVEALRHADPHLKRYGGHTAAGGFALFDENIAAFSNSILEFASSRPAPIETILTDALLEPHEVTFDMKRHLEKFEPFGQGNPAPVFLVRGPLRNAGPLGKEGKHFKYQIGSVSGKQWNFKGGFLNGDDVDAAVEVEENEWNGKTSLEFKTVRLRYQAKLQLLESDLDDGLTYPRLETKATLEKLKLDPASVFASGLSRAYIEKNYPMVPIHDVPGTPSGTLVLIALPDASLLEAWLAANVPLAFALTDKTISDLEHAPFWTLERLRDSFFRKRAGEDIPPRAKALLDQIRGVNLDSGEPYTICTDLVREEAEAYRLAQFCHAYRHADDAGFSRIVRVLYGKNIV